MANAGYPPGGGIPPQGYPPQGQAPPGYGPAQGYPPQGYPPPGYPPPGYPPPGYPPPGYPSPGYGAYGAPRRSAIPKVMGILMIIFASLGILGALIGLATGGGFGLPSGGGFGQRMQEELSQYTRVTNGIALPVAFLHLLAGIWAVRYRRSAPLLATSYAVVTILNQILTAFLLFSWYLPALERALPMRFFEQMRAAMMVGFVFGLLIGLTWPLLVLILMNRPAAKEACAG